MFYSLIYHIHIDVGTKQGIHIIGLHNRYTCKHNVHIE